MAIAAWFSWHISSDLTEERIRAEKTAEYHDNYAEDAIDEKCLSLDPIPMRDCIHKEIEAARDHERSEQDLDAQQAMARFTKVMGWTAIVGLALGAVSIGVIFATLREMSNTNQIMRNEQRPWLTIENVKINQSSRIDDPYDCTRIVVGITIKNHTDFPAHRAKVSVRFLEAGYGGLDEMCNAKIGGVGGSDGVFIPPNLPKKYLLTHEFRWSDINSSSKERGVLATFRLFIYVQYQGAGGEADFVTAGSFSIYRKGGGFFDSHILLSQREIDRFTYREESQAAIYK